MNEDRGRPEFQTTTGLLLDAGACVPGFEEVAVADLALGIAQEATEAEALEVGFVVRRAVVGALVREVHELGRRDEKSITRAVKEAIEEAARS